MDKIYLLLRNNKQTGPHNMEELVQLGLNPTDLIWVEGKSAGWRNPSEIDALKSSISGFSQQITNQDDKPIAGEVENATRYNTITIVKENPITHKHTKNVFVSLPEGFRMAAEERSFTGERYGAGKKPDAIEMPNTGSREVEAGSPDLAEMPAETTAVNLEKRAQELLNKIQVYSQAKTLLKKDNSTNADYTRSENNDKEESQGGQKHPINENRDGDQLSFEKTSIDGRYTRFINSSNEEYTDDSRKQPINEQRDGDISGFKRSDIDARDSNSLNGIKEEYPDWRKQKINRNSDVGESTVKKSDTNARYTDSLNDIKEEYPDWRKKQKIEEKKPIRRKPLLGAAALLCVVAFGLFWNSFNQNKSLSQVDDSTILPEGKESILPENKETAQTPSVNDGPLTFQEDYLPDANFFDSQIKKDQGKIMEETSLPDVEVKEAAVASETNKAKTEAPVIKEPIQIQPEKKEEKKVEIKEEKKPVINKKDDAVIQTSGAGPEIKKEEPSVPLTELIDIKGDYLPSQEGDGVNGYKVTMQNNSNKVLKVVAIDVFYYAANEKLLNKKTLYFSNVPPKTNMILTAPANKWAVAVSHQLGLVSSEAGALYFVKQ